jgi:hypothetical protein
MRSEQGQLESLVPMFIMMAQNRVGNRGGRIEPRALIRRPKALIEAKNNGVPFKSLTIWFSAKVAL